MCLPRLHPSRLPSYPSFPPPQLSHFSEWHCHSSTGWGALLCLKTRACPVGLHVTWLPLLRFPKLAPSHSSTCTHRHQLGALVGAASTTQSLVLTWGELPLPGPQQPAVPTFLILAQMGKPSPHTNKLNTPQPSPFPPHPGQF